MKMVRFAQHKKYCLLRKKFQIIALSALVALAIAAPAREQDGNAVIVKYSSDNIGVNGYSYGLENK